MRAKGISYDTGFVTGGTRASGPFDPAVVRRELTIIRDDLHCTAVQLVGGDPERLEVAAGLAAELGLEVWFTPYPLELAPEEMLALFADCAERAERVRRGGAEVVFVAGCELTLMDHGFLPGDTLQERLGALMNRRELVAEAGRRVAAFLAEAATVVRARFGGKVTYAAIPFEPVDWSLFDIMTIELIRSAEVADRFQDGVRSLVAQGRPVAITGFGTGTWRGAPDVAPRSMEIIEYDQATGSPVRLDGEYARDEAGQAAYLRELLEIFEAEGVDAAFVHTFALPDLPHRPGGDPRDDLDLASLGVVKVYEDRDGGTYPGLPWDPKAAFATVAACYGKAPAR
ncbi:hypothetical protein ABZW11_41055 [Nonomuraea sp. NPDC004580]|uniref:hypothetical protein n=1 Tax=Nonomuraea sp. NPDC004580 TaxID=3154552 RepID=UPI0033A3958D